MGVVLDCDEVWVCVAGTCSSSAHEKDVLYIINSDRTTYALIMCEITGCCWFEVGICRLLVIFIPGVQVVGSDDDIRLPDKQTCKNQW